MEILRPMPVDDRFKCSVCSHLIIEPQSAECGHRGCRSCYERLKSTDGAFCPKGEQECLQKPFSQRKIVPDRAFNRELMMATVVCSNTNFGCNKQMNYKDHAAHLIVCEQRTACRFSCGATFERSQFAAHEDTCHKKLIPCDLCRTEVLLGDLVAHKTNVCPESIDVCSSVGCSMPMLRRELGVHVASYHKRCRFHTMGCTEQGSIEHIANHEQGDAAHHYRVVAEYIETLKSREEAVTEKLADKKCWQALDGSDIREEELRSIHDALLRNLEIAQKKLDRLQAVPDVEQDLDLLFELHSNLQSLANQILILETEPNECPLSLSKEEMLYDQTFQLSALEKRVTRLETMVFDKNHTIIKFNNYHLLRAEMERQGLTMIDNLSLTHPKGYKLQLRLHPAGYGRGAGTHMSADLLVLVGDNDQFLKWPFKPKVTFRLRWGPDRPTIETIVEVGDGLARPIAGQPPPTIGCPLFALRQSIEDPSLYDNEHDCFFVEVVVDTGD